MKKLLLLLTLLCPFASFAATDVKDDPNLPVNLVSYWRLEETSGTRNDSDSTNHLTDNNTVLFGTGKQGNASDHEQDTSEYLSILDASQTGLDITGNMSIAAWTNPESLPSGAFTMDPVISKWSSTSNQRAYRFGIARDSGNVLSLGMNHSADGSASTNNYRNHAFTTATWYHIAMVYDAAAGSVEFFVNGSSIGTVTGLGTSTFNSSRQFEIGANSQQSEYVDGLIDEVGIWNKKLTSAEITDLYNSGSGLPWDAPDAPAGTALNNVIIFE